MFYEFNQNNSGGYFVENDTLCHRLFIEEDSLNEAISKAEDLGCYWDGVASGIDCPCCGDRWYEPWNDEGEIFPKELEVSDWSSLKNWNKKYGKYEIVEEPTRKSGYFGDSYYEGKIKIDNIEDYAQYLADNYGWTTPDIRIYYKDGNVKEIFTMKS